MFNVHFPRPIIARASPDDYAVVAPSHTAPEDYLVARVGVADIDKTARGVEALGVQVGKGYGEVFLLGGGEGADVFDVIEGHCRCSICSEVNGKWSQDGDLVLLK